MHQFEIYARFDPRIGIWYPIIKYKNHSERLRKFQFIAAKISILNEMVRIYRELTTVMYNVRTHVFPHLFMLLTWKLHSKITRCSYTFRYILGRIPWKLLFLYASLEIAENPTIQPDNLYIYIPICFQFDRNLCKVCQITKP